MKGLLYKDLSLIVSGYKLNFLYLLVFYGLITALTHLTFLSYALIFVVGLYASTTTAMDENSHWDAYARTLPVKPGQIVAVKYLLTLFFIAIGVVLASLMTLLIPGEAAPTPGEVALGLAAASMVTVFYYSLTIPLSYKFGSAKARSWVMIALFAVIFIPMAIWMALPDSVQDQFSNSLEGAGNAALSGGLSEMQVSLLASLGMVLLALVFLAVSWAVTTRIYTTKKF